MILEETEAHTKQCAFFAKSCEGSKCMAWEWYYTHPRNESRNPNAMRPKLVKTSSGSCGRVKS